MRFIGGCIAALAGSASVANPADQTGEEAGGEIAATLCGRCHSIIGPRPSPVATAPPFPVLVNRWPPAFLAEALAEGIAIGHQGEVRMPEFQLETATDRCSYSLRRRTPGGRQLTQRKADGLALRYSFLAPESEVS